MLRTTERRISILRILCERRKETLENLAFELEVSRNTIQRDIEVLSLTYPIYTSQGIGGGVCIVDNFRLGMKYLTNTQCELLETLLETQEGEAKEILHSIIKTFKKPECKSKGKK